MILNGKRALVTGGAVRIGRAITEALQAAGVEVVVHYLNSRTEAEALSPFSVCADLGSPADCRELVGLAGTVDILINNASLFTKDTLAEAMPERVLREFQVNLFAPMELMRTFAAQTEKGAVVNLLDRRIRCNDTSCVPYSIAKKGLEQLTQLAALEYAPNITVNAVAPGPILPPPGSNAASARELAGNIPLDRLPTPESIAEAVVFLLQADSITGQVVFVDGGQHLLGNGV
ncbi:MAG: SDR family oxidoreductase [Kiritimatiellales bacterium]|nr:SDR family oxidoreductase [Kiritimatiellales bacterium]MCF7863549.1 SDR family oxidoreductase [Kiritimatiellales bacterium]